MSSPPKPQIQHIPLPSPSSDPTQFIDLISSLLTPSECAHLISTHQNLIPSNVTPGTIRTREQFEDGALAEEIWERMRGFYEGDRIQDEDGEWWRVKGLNFVWRLCRYEKGGKFSAHFDGRRLEDLNTQSFLTVNIYLNTIPSSSCGSTRILQSPLEETETETETGYQQLKPVTEDQILFKIQPVLGTAALFRDTVWHDGEELLEGEKYLLRTDVMYEREEEFDFDRLYGGLGDREKGMKALGIAEGLEDAGNREEAVRWYKKAFRLCPEMG